MYRYILATGSNRGDREAYLQAACDSLNRKGVKVLQKTRTMDTAPAHVKNQARFLNQGLLVETELVPEKLLDLIQAAEQEIGRTKSIAYGPREIDIDIVWWSEGVYRYPGLDIPHPYNLAREWVKRILFELLPEKEKGTIMPESSIQYPADFRFKKEKGEKIVAITAYDYSMAKSLARTSVDMVLVGDSLGNVIQGRGSTIGVTLDEMIYHAKMVKKGCPDLFMTIDLPFLSYHVSPEESVKNAGRAIVESGAESVKLEGGSERIPMIRAILNANIPVMGHLGLTPQSQLKLEGFGVQARETKEAQKLLEDAKALEEAGVFAIVLEKIPASLASEVSKAIQIPTIGIGAGAGADGQVLVLYDLLGFDPDFSPRFVRKYANFSEEMIKAVEAYSTDVRQGSFPGESESYR